MASYNTSTFHPHDLTGRRGGLRELLRFVSRMAEAIETRQQLAQLDDRMLADIGISRADAEAEYERAPWDMEPLRTRR